jgi:Protein of unknown function (DUF3551)
MKKSIVAGLVLCALVAASGKANAYVNYPWCIIGDTRAVDCVFMTREQCSVDGRNRGFGSQCIKNPFYNPALPPVVGQGTLPRSASPVIGEESPKHRRRKSRRH